MFCFNEGCDNQVLVRKLCKNCYDKWYRTTDKGKAARLKAQRKNTASEKRKQYRKKYNQLYKTRRNELRNKRRKEDKQYHLTCVLRDRIYHAVKRLGINKPGSAVKDLGCSIAELKIYIETKFQQGMSWDNYGRIPGIKCWEIDHIIPLSKLDLSNRKEFLKACHYTNLQPMWQEDNIRKFNKIIEEDNYDNYTA